MRYILLAMFAALLTTAVACSFSSPESDPESSHFKRVFDNSACGPQPMSPWCQIAGTYTETYSGGIEPCNSTQWGAYDSLYDGTNGPKEIGSSVYQPGNYTPIPWYTWTSNEDDNFQSYALGHVVAPITSVVDGSGATDPYNSDWNLWWDPYPAAYLGWLHVTDGSLVMSTSYIDHGILHTPRYTKYAYNTNGQHSAFRSTFGNQYPRVTGDPATIPDETAQAWNTGSVSVHLRIDSEATTDTDYQGITLYARFSSDYDNVTATYRVPATHNGWAATVVLKIKFCGAYYQLGSWTPTITPVQGEWHTYKFTQTAADTFTYFIDGTQQFSYTFSSQNIAVETNTVVTNPGSYYVTNMQWPANLSWNGQTAPKAGGAYGLRTDYINFSIDDINVN